MPLSDVIPFMGGSVPVPEEFGGGEEAAAPAATPQAAGAEEAILRRLGISDDTLAKYGDVLGTRPRGLKDVGRDFAIGLVTRDPMAASKMKADLVNSVEGRKEKARQAALAQEKENRLKAQTYVGTLIQLTKSTLSPATKREVLKEVIATNLGVDAPAGVLKMLTESEELQQMNPQALLNAVLNGDITLEGLAEVHGDSAKTMTVLTQFGQIRKNEQALQKGLLQIDKLKRGGGGGAGGGGYGGKIPSNAFALLEQERRARAAGKPYLFENFKHLSNERLDQITQEAFPTNLPHVTKKPAKEESVELLDAIVDRAIGGGGMAPTDKPKPKVLKMVEQPARGLPQAPSTPMPTIPAH